MKKFVAVFLSVILITCLLALPVSAENYEFKNGFSIDVPSTYKNQKSLYKNYDPQVLDNNTWVMQENNDVSILMTQVSKNTDNLKIKKATASEISDFEKLCQQMIDTKGYEIDMNTKKEKLNGYDTLHMYLNEIKDTKGTVLYGDMYIFSSKKHIYYVYLIYYDKNYSTTSEYSNILNSFEIKDKTDLLGGNNLIIYIGVGAVAIILLLVIIAAKKKQRTVYFNDPGNLNSYQQNTNPYGNTSYPQNSYNQPNTNPYGNNSYPQNNYTQPTIDQYGNNTYQQTNTYYQQSSYQQGDLNNASSNGYGTSTQQNTNEWLSSPSKPADDNDPNKLADEFWNKK